MSTHKPRGYSVNDFISWHDRKELVLQPKFQRRDVWTAKAKSHLIDTILRGLPAPIIFIRQQIDPAKHQTMREVVDGQQRLRAILGYVKDEFPVLKGQNPDYGDMKFSQLPQAVQGNFLGYEFSVVLLEGAEDQTVLDIFARLNTYAQSLTAQELLNAAFFGEFKQTVYGLGYEHLEFWRSNRILNDRQIVRMGEAELVTELLVMMLTGIQNRRAQVRESYEKYDDAFPKRSVVRTRFKAVIDVINQSFGDSLRRGMFRKRALFSSLFYAFYHLMFGIPDTPELPSSKVHRFSPDDCTRVKGALGALEARYRQVPPEEEMVDFIKACQRGTADREQRILRTNKIVQVIAGAVP